MLEFILKKLLLLGGYIHGRHKLTYGVDLDHIRLLGVLQVIYKLHMFIFEFVLSSFYLLNFNFSNCHFASGRE